MRGVVFKTLKIVRKPIKPGKTKNFCKKRAEHPRMFAESTKNTANNGKNRKHKKPVNNDKNGKKRQKTTKKTKRTCETRSPPLIPDVQMHAF